MRALRAEATRRGETFGKRDMLAKFGPHSTASPKQVVEHVVEELGSMGNISQVGLSLHTVSMSMFVTLYYSVSGGEHEHVRESRRLALDLSFTPARTLRYRPVPLSPTGLPLYGDATLETRHAPLDNRLESAHGLGAVQGDEM